MEPETNPTTFSSSSSGITSRLSETTKELNDFVERLAEQSPHGNTMGTMSISGLEGVKFVPLNNAAVDGSVEENIADAVQSTTTTMASTSSQEGDDTTAEITLGEGMEIYIEMDDAVEPTMMFAMDGVLDNEMEQSPMPTVTTTSPTDADMDGSTTSTSSLSDILLHEHHGAAYRLMDARRQQMIRQVESTTDRITALKAKINTM